MFIGVSMNIKDKRLDSILKLHNVDNPAIFYSPISIWLLLLCYLISMVGGIIIYLFTTFYCIIFVVSYLIISYLIAAKNNYSFAIAKNKIFIINPNFPFRHFKTFDVGEIDCVIFKQKNTKIARLFFIFGINCVEIKVGSKYHSYACHGLEMDAFDENLTEKTIEDLHLSIQSLGVPTKFLIPD